jgi:hypothetical protein
MAGLHEHRRASRQLRHLHATVVSAMPPSNPAGPVDRQHSLLTASESHLHEVTPLATHVLGPFGAQLEGVDLSRGWSDALVDTIRRALAEYKLVKIPGQQE